MLALVIGDIHKQNTTDIWFKTVRKTTFLLYKQINREKRLNLQINERFMGLDEMPKYYQKEMISKGNEGLKFALLNCP